MKVDDLGDTAERGENGGLLGGEVLGTALDDFDGDRAAFVDAGVDVGIVADPDAVAPGQGGDIGEALDLVTGAEWIGRAVGLLGLALLFVCEALRGARRHANATTIVGARVSYENGFESEKGNFVLVVIFL
jgi:hypothetical protein